MHYRKQKKSEMHTRIHCFAINIQRMLWTGSLPSFLMIQVRRDREAPLVSPLPSEKGKIAVADYNRGRLQRRAAPGTEE